MERVAVRWNIALRLHTVLSRAARTAVDHDCFNVAQATAYSAIFALFPALIVTAAAISLLPVYAPIREQLYFVFDQIFPPQVSLLVESYFDLTPRSPHTVSAIIGALGVSLTGATAVITTLMEGFRRAQGAAERRDWGFWPQRRRALTMVPLLVGPLFGATLLIVFGDLISAWISGHVPSAAAPLIYVLATTLRWCLALAVVVWMLAVLYRYGTYIRQGWSTVVPGAITAAILWFMATLCFGWYARHFANYSRVYGSLGVGIALMIWLYILFLTVLAGAEFNAHFFEVCVWEPGVRRPPVE